VIADPLQVVRDPDRGYQKSQVARDRLLQSEEAQALTLDLELNSVDGHVLGDHFVRQPRISGFERLHRFGQGGLRPARHFAQAVVERFKIVVEVSVHYPNRPVM
jgi:hypothetical protein